MNLYEFSAKTVSGRDQSLSEYKGHVVLIVNVASQCGFTPQYKGLEELYKKYGSQKFTVLGFPCNQFGGQEPGTETEIQGFCELNFGVTFPLFSKVEVNGQSTHPLFAWLKSTSPGILGTEAIKWNFTKFLIGRDGNVIERFAPQTTPESLALKIEKALSLSA